LRPGRACRVAELEREVPRREVAAAHRGSDAVGEGAGVQQVPLRARREGAGERRVGPHYPRAAAQPLGGGEERDAGVERSGVLQAVEQLVELVVREVPTPGRKKTNKNKTNNNKRINKSKI
jgi:hypothetical protein